MQQHLRWSTACVWGTVFAIAFVSANSARAVDYELVGSPEYLKLPDDLRLGACSAVAVNSQGEVFLFHRGKRPVLCFGADGQFRRSWGDGIITTAHGLRIDRHDNVWTTDMGGHRVLKFSSTGELLLALGTGKPGTGTDEFNKPTDIAFGPRNEVYISDGYGNSRVMKFTSEGRFVQAWGIFGKGDGEFHLPHSIIVDTCGRVLVGDRENDRIQIFDGEGKLLEIWTGFAPYGLALDPHGALFVADARANKVLRLDERGKVQQTWGSEGNAPGQFDVPHMLTFDASGNLYVAEVNGKRLQKFIRKTSPQRPLNE